MNQHTTQWERGLLPRVLDAIADLLELMIGMNDDGDEDIIMMVLDFVNAFFLIPLAKE